MKAVHTFFAISLLAIPLICAGTADAQVVSLESTTYAVVEGTPQITITVLVSAPVSDYGGCSVTFDDIEAENGEDYVPLTGWVQWFGGDGSPKEVVVDITDDEELEPTETFTATISYAKQLTIGSPSQATISITDNDGGGGDPFAYVDMTGATRNASGEWVLFAPGGDAFDVTVHYSEVPGSPASIDWESDASPYSGTIVFDDTDVQTVTLDMPTLKGNDPMTLIEFRLIQQEGRSGGALLERGFDFELFNFFVGTGAFTGTDCWGCVFYLFSNLADFGPCPFECDFLDLCGPDRASADTRRAHSTAGSLMSRLGGAVFPERIALMRRYRDEILVNTEVGEYYTSEYESFSSDAVAATLRRPMLFFRIMDAMEAWIPALEDLLDGAGTTVVISQNMVDRLNVVLDAFEEVGDAAFAAMIATERSKLQVDAMVGLSAAQAQAQIETLGGEVPTQTVSWGSLKQQYR